MAGAARGSAVLAPVGVVGPAAVSRGRARLVGQLGSLRRWPTGHDDAQAALGAWFRWVSEGVEMWLPSNGA